MSPPDIFDALVEKFLEHKRHTDGRQPRTIAAYRDVLARFKVFMAGRDPRTAQEDELLLFTGLHLNKQFGLHARSRIPYVACIRGFYSWLQQRGQCEVNLAARIEYPAAGKPLPDVMSMASAEKLMAAPDFSRFEGVRDAAMMALLIGCGLRVSGLVGLNRSALVEYELRDRYARTERRLGVRTLEKGNKERLLPIPREAELLIRMYLEHPDRAGIDAHLKDGDEVLFVNTINRRCPPHEWVGEKRRLTARGVQRIIERYADKVGVPRREAHPHAARHLFGTELTEDDTPLQVTGALLGHGSAESTKIYTHLALRKATSVVDKAGPLSKIKTPASALLGMMKERFTV
ncbi:tyrosine-type recombinase/integrase [Chitinimonas sp.]|uniref:tyrosine-type recombinase/integrase n=1 Tax=Chitinimonas sp. TaxID=1934313 RepID=UPI0035B08FF3